MLNTVQASNDDNYSILDWLEGKYESPSDKSTPAIVAVPVVVQADQPPVTTENDIKAEVTSHEVVIVKPKARKSGYRLMSGRVAYALGDDIRDLVCPVGDEPVSDAKHRLAALRFVLVTTCKDLGASQKREAVQSALDTIHNQYRESFGGELNKVVAPRALIMEIEQKIMGMNVGNSSALDSMVKMLEKKYGQDTKKVGVPQQKKLGPKMDLILEVRTMLARHIGAEAAEILVSEESGQGDLADVCSTVRWMVISSAQRLAGSKDCTDWMKSEAGNAHSACANEISVSMSTKFGIVDLRNHRVDTDVRDAYVERLRRVEGNTFLKAILPPAKRQSFVYVSNVSTLTPSKPDDRLVRKAEQNTLAQQKAETERQKKLEEDRKTLEKDREAMEQKLKSSRCTDVEADRIMQKVCAGRSLDDIATGYVQAGNPQIAEKIFSALGSPNPKSKVEEVQTKLEKDRQSKLKVESKDYGDVKEIVATSNKKGKKKDADKPKKVSQKVAGSKGSAKAKKGKK